MENKEITEAKQENKEEQKDEGNKKSEVSHAEKSRQSELDDYDRDRSATPANANSRENKDEDMVLDDDLDEENKQKSAREDERRQTGRSNEREQFIPQHEKDDDIKTAPYAFTAINTPIDPLKFNLKTKYRFSCFQRFLSSCCCCCGGRSIQLMKQDLPEHPFNSEEDKYKEIQIQIQKSGPLELNQYILHPFVKIHIVDLDTYMYLAKSTPTLSTVYNKETSGYYNSFKNHFQGNTIDYFLPLSTTHYDLRPKAENFCSWYQSFVLDVKAEYFLRPNVIILFEVLDYSPALLLEGSSKLNADNFLPIAWGFLRPIGAACQHLADSKIQLYYYKGNHSKFHRYKHDIDLRTPDVLCELNWTNKSKYPSYLEVNVSFFKTEEKKVITHFSRYPWEKEVGLIEYKYKDQKKKLIKFGKQPTKELEPEDRLKYFKWERGKNEPCKRPNKFLRKLDTEESGAFRIKFSHCGEHLAAACTFESSMTVIKIFKTTTGELLMRLRGHHDLIHELTWSQDDNLLVSASGDGSVKIWNVTDKDEDIPDKLSHIENDKFFFVAELIHPSYVYSAKFFKENDQTSYPYKILTTICFDQTIKFWMFAINERGEYMYNSCIKTINILNIDNMKKVFIENKIDMDFLQNPTLFQYVHPNCLAFDKSGRMIVGDSIGLIRIWDVSYEDGEIYADNYFIIKQAEIEDDIINKIIPDPNDEDRLIIHSRDSCIRVIEYNHQMIKDAKVRMRFFGSTSQYQMIQSCISPDGMYLASASESGNIFVWNVPTGELFSQDYNCKFVDSTCDVDWNNKYNMIATSGFSDSYPILIYVYEKTQKEVDFALGKNLATEDFFSDKDTIMSTPRKVKPSKKSILSDDLRSNYKSENGNKVVYSEERSLTKINRDDSGENLVDSPGSERHSRFY